MKLLIINSACMQQKIKVVFGLSICLSVRLCTADLECCCIILVERGTNLKITN